MLLARKLDIEMPPDSLEAGGVNELSVAAAAPIVGYLSPAQICDACAVVSSIAEN